VDEVDFVDGMDDRGKKDFSSREVDMSTDDPFDLNRFLEAQEGVYAQALAELRAGRKTSHWMWFVFPQIDGLGRSSTARRYAIRSLEEARAYLAHPVLGTRLRECTAVVLGVSGRSAAEIFGHPDDIKFRSSMTLFERATSDTAIFTEALDRHFAGKRDQLTLELLSAATS
jgi:uncharacterized protein (DUF1810 family)